MFFCCCFGFFFFFKFVQQIVQKKKFVLTIHEKKQKVQQTDGMFHARGGKKYLVRIHKGKQFIVWSRK